MRLIFALTSTLVLAACASNSGVVPMGQDNYFISRQAATGFSGMGSLKAEAIAEAGQICSAKGRIVDAG